jgi:ketosteroid isomerase-like protein
MLTERKARDFARHWVQAWNSHDLDQIMSHYAGNVVLVSPVAAKLLNRASGTVKGKDAVRAYFTRGLAAFPGLKFKLVDVMWSLSSVVLYYENQRGTRTGEFMELGADGKVIQVIAHYNG